MARCMAIQSLVVALLSLIVAVHGLNVGVEEDWGEGLKVLTTYMPESCEYAAEDNDVIHYHYVGRLGDTGEVFGRSFDYDSPYIVALGQRRIIAGMDRGLQGTCLWERRRITIPPHLGYGQRGVGSAIPPNSTLVFYIRMIKIERDGLTLGRDATLEGVWDKGIESYSAQRWEECIERINKAQELFEEYQNATMHCLRSCHDTEINLTRADEATVDFFSASDPLFRQFLVYMARANCIVRCKAENLPTNLRAPDPLVLEKFQKRVPFSYLHFAYYNLERIEDGAKAAFTYFFYNPNDTMITSSIAYYRKELGLKADDYISVEPGLSPHQRAYKEGRQAYESKEWLKSADLMESAVDLYLKELEECRLGCEDILAVNISKHMSVEKTALLSKHNFTPDSMEYYQLLTFQISRLLECRAECRVRMDTLYGKYHEKYLPLLFSYLQFDYFKLGRPVSAAIAASTFMVLEPSDVTMQNNLKLYRTSQKVSPDLILPRKDVVKLSVRDATEKRLLAFSLSGSPQRKVGKRGDEALAGHDEL